MLRVTHVFAKMSPPMYVNLNSKSLRIILSDMHSMYHNFEKLVALKSYPLICVDVKK